MLQGIDGATQKQTHQPSGNGVTRLPSIGCKRAPVDIMAMARNDEHQIGASVYADGVQSSGKAAWEGHTYACSDATRDRDVFRCHGNADTAA